MSLSLLKRQKMKRESDLYEKSYTCLWNKCIVLDQYFSVHIYHTIEGVKVSDILDSLEDSSSSHPLTINHHNLAIERTTQYIQKIFSDIQPLSFLNLFQLIETLCSDSNLASYLPELVCFFEQIKQGVFPMYEHENNIRTTTYKIRQNIWNRMFDEIGNGTKFLPRDQSIMTIGDLFCKEITLEITPNPTAVVNLIKTKLCPEIILQCYMQLHETGDQPRAKVRIGDLESVLRFQDFNSLQKIIECLPDLPAPEKTLEIIGSAFGFKHESAKKSVELMINHYSNITIKFSSDSRSKYSKDVIILLMKKKANPFDAGSLLVLSSKWPNTWGVALKNFFLPMFNNWQPSAFKHMPNTFHDSIVTFVKANFFLKKQNKSYLPKDMMMIIIRFIAVGTLIDMEQPRILEDMIKPDLVKLCNLLKPFSSEQFESYLTKKEKEHLKLCKQSYNFYNTMSKGEIGKEGAG